MGMGWEISPSAGAPAHPAMLSLFHWRFALLVAGALLALSHHQHLLGAIFVAAAVPEILRVQRRSGRPSESARMPGLLQDPASEPAAARAELDVAALSHELKAPLIGVLGLAQILAETDLNAEQRSLIARIVRSSQNLNGLLDTLMDSAKPKPGAGGAPIVIERSAVDLLRLRDDIVAPLQMASKQRGSLSPSIEFKSEVRLDGHRFLMGDPVRLQQIGGNLLNNAMKFTENGEIVLRMTVLRGARGPLLRLSVADTGIGIAVHRLKAIFDRFEQASPEIHGRFGGSGLGLSIVQDITEALGGELTVRSTVGVGSIFTADVPMATMPEPARAQAQPQPGLRPAMI